MDNKTSYEIRYDATNDDVILICVAGEYQATIRMKDYVALDLAKDLTDAVAKIRNTYLRNTDGRAN